MFYNARWYDSYLNHFTQPDSIVPDPYNPQDWDRYSYVRNNPLRYTDPSGHKYCLKDDKCDDNLLTGSGKDFFRDYEGYSRWERNVLSKLFEKGGPSAVHGVMHILENDIHISVGNSFTYDMRGAHGDWQSLGNVAGWYDRNSNSLVLNPNAGYKPDEMPDSWGLTTIIHEAKHLEQGSPLTKYKELEAMQTGIDVTAHLGGYYGPPGQQPSSSSRDGLILALPLSHNSQVINQYSEILHNDPSTYWYWFFYRFLPNDSPHPAP
jgi:hypothetical protein